MLRKNKINPAAEYNYAYYPIVFDSERDVLRVKKAMEIENIFPRRYFYPSLSKLTYVRPFNTPIADIISKSVLCLPLYYNLTFEEIDSVCKIIKQTLV